MADGSIIIDTALDSTGLKRGLGALGKTAAAGMAAITATVGLAGMAAIKMGMAFEEGMSKVAAISGATGEDLEILTEKAKEMGEKTKFSATEASEAFQYMAMAGWKTHDMLGGIEGIMNLAAASGENLALVSDIVTDALTAFGLKAQDAGRFSDVLAAASSNSNTNVAMMGATFKYAAPIAGALGYTIEDTAAAIGLMANAGIKADQAGTALRSMMTNLASPPKMAAKAIDELNLSMTNADGTMKPFSQVIDELREKFAGMTKSQQVANAKALAGQEAMSGLLAIVNAAPSDLEKLRGAIDSSAGSAKKMAEIMQDNLKGQLVILGSTLEGLGIKVYDKFEKPFRAATKSAIKSVTDLSKSMADGKLSDSVDTIATGFGNLVKGAADFATKAIPPLINGFALIVENARFIVAGFVAMKAAMIAHNVVVALTTTLHTFAAGSVTGLHVAVGVLTGKVGMATAAQLLWNVALNANIIGLVVTAVAALAAGFGILMITQEKEISETDTLTQSIQEQKTAWDELKTAQVADRDEKLAEIDHTKQLWAELQTLIDVNGKVTGDKERAKFITMELNALAPDSIRWTEKETVAIDKNAESISNLLELKRAQALLDSQEPAYQEAISTYREKQNEQARLSIKIKETEAEVAKAQQEAERTHTNVSLGLLEEKKKALKAEQDAYAENDKLKNEMLAAIAEQERLQVAITNKNYGEIGDILKNYGVNLKTASTATAEELTEQRDIADENLKLIQEDVKKGVKGATQAMVDEATATFEAAEAELTAKTKEVGENAALGVAEGMDSKEGEVKKSVFNLASIIPQGLKNFLGIHSPSRLLRDEVGKFIPMGVSVGINGNLNLLHTAVAGMGAMIASTAKQTLSGGQFNALGAFVGQQLSGGIKSTEGLLEDTMQTLGDKLMDAHLSNAEKLGLLQEETEKESHEKMKRLGIEAVNKNYLAFVAAEKEKIKATEAEIEKLKNMSVKERNERLKAVELNATGKKAEEIAMLEKGLLEKKEQELADISEKSKKAKGERVAAIEKKYVEEKNKALLDLEIKSLEEEKKVSEQFTTEYAKAFENLVTEYDTAQQKITDSQTKMTDKLAAFGTLYDTIKGTDDGGDFIKLHDIQGDIDKLDKYSLALETLKNKKPPDGFMDEVLAMDIDEALGYMEVLNAQTGKDYDAYINQWSEKQNKAKEIAQRYYKDQFGNLKSEFDDKIDRQMGLMPGKAKQTGINYVKSMNDGVNAEKGTLFKLLDEFVEKFLGVTGAANDMQQAIADATGAQASFDASSRSSQTITNDNGVQQNMNFFAPTVTPSEIARANRKMGVQLANVNR